MRNPEAGERLPAGYKRRGKFDSGPNFFPTASLQLLVPLPSRALHEHQLPPAATTEMGFNRLTLATAAACTVVATLLSLAAVTEASVLPGSAPTASNSDFINGIDSVEIMDGVRPVARQAVTAAPLPSNPCRGKPDITVSTTCPSCGGTTTWKCTCSETNYPGYFSIFVPGPSGGLWYNLCRDKRVKRTLEVHV